MCGTISWQMPVNLKTIISLQAATNPPVKQQMLFFLQIKQTRYKVFMTECLKEVGRPILFALDRDCLPVSSLSAKPSYPAVASHLAYRYENAIDLLI